MPFSTTEKTNKADKLSLQISGGADDAPGAKFWYNEEHAWTVITPPSKLWGSFSSIPGATTPLVADANAVTYPSILEKRIIRLTLNPTSNNRQYEARMTYGDRTTDIYENWILPALIRNAGEPSNGYMIRLYDGDPAGAGIELPTTYLGGAGGEPSWEWNYASGILKVSTDQRAAYGAINAGSGLWVSGYRYVGIISLVRRQTFSNATNLVIANVLDLPLITIYETIPNPVLFGAHKYGELMFGQQLLGSNLSYTFLNPSAMDYNNGTKQLSLTFISPKTGEAVIGV